MSNAILRFFDSSHLKPELRQVVAPIAAVARLIEDSLPDGPEKSAGLRKLLEAKDCFVRAALSPFNEPQPPAEA